MNIYKIINKINGKSYVGMNATDSKNYFGSGVAIRLAIKKYGKKNFEKIILESGFKSIEEMSKAEQKWIAIERKSNINGIYNLNDGGYGSCSNAGKTAEEILGTEKARLWKIKISKTLKDKKIIPPSRCGMGTSEKQKIAVSETNKKRIRTAEEIEKRAEKQRIRILCINNNTVYKSMTEACKDLMISIGNLSSILNGKRKHTKGLFFRKIEK